MILPIIMRSAIDSKIRPNPNQVPATDFRLILDDSHTKQTKHNSSEERAHEVTSEVTHLSAVGRVRAITAPRVPLTKHFDRRQDVVAAAVDAPARGPVPQRRRMFVGHDLAVCDAGRCEAASVGVHEAGVDDAAHGAAVGLDGRDGGGRACGQILALGSAAANR